VIDVLLKKITTMGNQNKPSKYYLENGKAKGILIDIMKYMEVFGLYKKQKKRNITVADQGQL